MERSPRPQRRRRRRQQRQSQPSRFGASSLVVSGLIIGLVGALIYAWLLNPVVFANATPARFSPEFKAEYLYLVSQSYAEDKNLARAQSRLAALEMDDLPAYVSSQLDAYLRQGRSPGEVQNLAALAVSLGVDSPVVAFFGPTPPPGSATPTANVVVPTLTATFRPTLPPTVSASPSSAPLPTATNTPRPTATPMPTYRLLSQERACLTDEAVDEIEVIVLDAFLDPLPGAEIVVEWEGGSDHFFTGFIPSQGPGYADFTMAADVSYSVQMAEGSPIASGLRIERCSAELGGLEGGWQLTFQRLVIDAGDDDVGEDVESSEEESSDVEESE